MGLYFLLGEGLRYKFSETGPINELDDSDFGNLSLHSKLNWLISSWKFKFSILLKLKFKLFLFIFESFWKWALFLISFSFWSSCIWTGKFSSILLGSIIGVLLLILDILGIDIGCKCSSSKLFCILFKFKLFSFSSW